MSTTRFRLGRVHKMSNEEDQKAIENLKNDIKGLFSSGSAAPDSNTAGVLYADTTNGKIYCKQDDSWVEVGNT